MASNKSTYLLLQPLRISVLLSLLFFTFLTGYATSALTAQITGSILLPSGQAPVGGLEIDIEAYDDVSGDSVSTSVTLEEGSSSKAYTLYINDNANASWLINYSYSGNDYLKYGYYATNGTTWDENGSTLLTGGGNHSGIDMTLLKGNTITGTISLPSGQQAPAGGLGIGIKAFYEDYSDVAGSSSMIIPEGSSSGTYTMQVPDDTNAAWRIKYLAGSSDYLQDGYYVTNGTTWDQNSATSLSGGQDYSDINMTLLTGKTIQGTISLPSGKIAPSGGISVDIGAFDANHTGGGGLDYIIIQANRSSADYTLRVPDNTNATWVISYTCLNTDYRQMGYYASTGTSGDSGGATLLDGGQDYTEIDMTLLTGKTIQGTITLPLGRTAPAGGLKVEIDASAYYNGNVVTGYTTITILEGDSSETYTLRVTDDVNASWRIAYYVLGGGDWTDGYYSSNGTTGDQNEATLLPGGQDYTEIDMILIPQNTIRGIVSLPPGRSAPAGGLQIFINADDANSGDAGMVSITIPEGISSGSYTLPVPYNTAASWLVSYGYYGSYYLHYGFYNTSTGTQKDSSHASLLPGGQDYSGIDMTILSINSGHFSWNLFLPAILSNAKQSP